MKIYEKLCHRFGFLPFKFKNKKLEKAIKFCRLDVTVREVYSLSFVLPLILLLIGFPFLAFLPLAILGVYSVLCMLLSYWLYRYPISLQRSIRIKLSSEMVNAVIYMASSLRETPNLEKAIEFTASSLTGPLKKDFEEMLWSISVGESANEVLLRYSNKWKGVSDEFVEAMNMLRNYHRKGALDEAVSIITEGTKEKMEDYAISLRNPVRLLDLLGFTLPLMVIVLSPIILMLRPFPGDFVTLASLYCIFLPLTLYWLIKIALEKRPWTFPVIDISENPEAIPENRLKIKKFLIPAIPVSLVLGGLIMLPGIRFLLSPRPYSFTNVANTLTITCGISIALSIYYYSSKHNFLLKERIKAMEREIPEGVYSLGDSLTRGLPLEKALERAAEKISGLSISDLFKKTVENIRNFGMTLEEALFDKRLGSLRYYPSRTLKCVMRVVCDAAKKSIAEASKVCLWIGEHLKAKHDVERKVIDVTEETGSSMQIECMLLAPLVCAVAVVFASVIMEIMTRLGEMIGRITAYGGAGGTLFGGFLFIFQSLNTIITPEYFQIVVGIYLIEVIYLLSMFQSKLENGEDVHARRYLTAKYLFFGCLIYTLVLLTLIFIFYQVLPFRGLSV